MRQTFPTALAFVLKSEGGYSDNKNDSGGATNHGITHTEYDAYRKSCGLAPQSVKLITTAEVATIYRARYWDAIAGDQLAAPIDFITFDAAVNMGVGTAIRMLDLATDLPTHLAPTPALIAKVKQLAGSATLLKQIEQKEFEERIARYHAIVVAHAKDQEFLHGWLNRVAALEIAVQHLPAPAVQPAPALHVKSNSAPAAATPIAKEPTK